MDALSALPAISQSEALPVNAPLPDPPSEGGAPPSGRRAWQSQLPAHPLSERGGGFFAMDTGAILDALGYLAAGLGSLIEGAGIAFPGQVILLAAAAWPAACHGSLGLVILIGFAGATAGADIGYYLGYRGWRPLVERFGTLIR